MSSVADDPDNITPVSTELPMASLPVTGANPVREEDFEKNVPAEWWRTVFDSALYLKTDGDVVENAEATREDVDVLCQATTLSQSARVLDLCCGQGRHSLELANRGFAYVHGVDQSEYLIGVARTRRNEMKWRHDFFRPRFAVGDARNLHYKAGYFDVVAIMGNSFGYASPADDVHILSEVRRVLRPNGMIFLDLMDGDYTRTHFQKRSWEWIDNDLFVCRERALSKDGDMIISREVIVHGSRGVVRDQFYAERLLTFAQIEALLAKCGFTQVKLVRSIDGMEQSWRSQDLGMMESRMCIVARAEPPSVESAAINVDLPYTRDVSVLLGDPRKADVVKLHGEFSPEDLEVVRKLRDALQSVPGIALSFLDSHDTLIDDLRDNPPKFVLNLCDEGFNNDAFQELHITALLDMMGVEYSGAQARCLAHCYDKGLVAALASSLDIPTPRNMKSHEIDSAQFPVIVKPLHGDGSIGITQHSVVYNARDAHEAVARLQRDLPDHGVIVQEFLTGPEFTVALVGNGTDLLHLGTLEVDYSGIAKISKNLPHILGHESKWDPESPYWNDIAYRRATCLDADTEARVVEQCKALFRRLACRDYARFDFRMREDGECLLLEVNPNPGWPYDGKMALICGFRGESYADLIMHVIRSAQHRIANAKKH